MNSENPLKSADKDLIGSAIELCQYLLASQVCKEEQRGVIAKAIDLIASFPSRLNYDGEIRITAQLFPDGSSGSANLKRWWTVSLCDGFLAMYSWYDDPALDQDEEDEFEFSWELRNGVSEVRSDTTPTLWFEQIRNFEKLIEPGYELNIEAIERLFENKNK